MGTVTVAVPRSVCVRPTVWARDLITMEVHLQSTAGSWVCVWSTWTGPRELGAWGEDGIKSSCPFRIDPIDDVAWETRRLGSRDDWQLEQTAIRVPPLCRGWPDAFGRRREGHLYGVDNWRCPSSPRDNWNKIHDPKGAISNPFEADPMFPISSFLRDQRRKTGGKCRGHLGDWTVTGEGVASDHVSQRLVPTAHAHRPQKAAMLSASLIADAVLACSCPESRGGPSWSRTFRVAFSGRRAWIACPAGFGTCGNLTATAALTTLRITSTGSHPHRALCWLPATWLAAEGSQEQRPQVPCHPPAAVLHPPHHDEPPNQLWRGAPPQHQQHPGPLLFCRCIPSDCAPGHLAAPSRTAAGPTSTIVTSLGVPRTWLLSFLPSASSSFAHHPRVPSIRLSYHLAAINLRNRRSIVRRTSAQRPIRIPIRC